MSLFHQINVKYAITFFAKSRKHFFSGQRQNLAEIECIITATLNYSLQYTCSKKRPNDWQINMNHNQTDFTVMNMVSCLLLVCPNFQTLTGFKCSCKTGEGLCEKEQKKGKKLEKEKIDPTRNVHSIECSAWP